MTNATHHIAAELIHDTECLLAILRTINDVNDLERQSFLVDAAENIGSSLLRKLQCNEVIEDAAASEGGEAGEAE